MMAFSYWQVLILAVAVMAFGIGVFYLTYSADLPDPTHKRRASAEGLGASFCKNRDTLINSLHTYTGNAFAQ